MLGYTPIWTWYTLDAGTQLRRSCLRWMWSIWDTETRAWRSSLLWLRSNFDAQTRVRASSVCPSFWIQERMSALCRRRTFGEGDSRFLFCFPSNRGTRGRTQPHLECQVSVLLSYTTYQFFYIVVVNMIVDPIVENLLSRGERF